MNTETCDMGDLCIGCAPRNADGSCPDKQPVAEYDRQQPCGCVLCVCEDDKQCHGCGSKHCGNLTNHPAYVTKQPTAVDGAMLERAWKAAASACVSIRDGKHTYVAPVSPADWYAALMPALTAALATQHQKPDDAAAYWDAPIGDGGPDWTGYDG